MKNFIFLIFAFSMTFNIQASNTKLQEPAGYYDDADGKTGYELKTALKTIITNGHTDQGYDSLYTLYETSDTDSYYENDNTVLDMYSEKPSGADDYEYTHNSDTCGSYSAEGDCYNREHIVPQSVFDSDAPMKNDGHFVVPADGYVNNKRSNYPFGIVSSADWTSTNGSKVGNNSTTGYSNTVFEPIDEFKGDVARMLFYFATRYEDQVAGWTHDMLNGTSDQVYTDWFLSIIKQWHEDDPVSQREIDRNEAVYDYQGNRNPFIDHPEWVSSVWGSDSSSSAPATNTVIAIQDFDGTTPEWSFTTDVTFFDNNSDGFYGIHDADGDPNDGTPTDTGDGNASDVAAIDYANISGDFLFINDLDDEGDNGTSGDATLTFDAVDVSSYTNINFSFDYDIVGFDSADYVKYEVFIDGTGQGEVELPKDNEGTVSVSIPDGTSSFYFVIISKQNGGGDQAGLDNFKLTGDTSSTDEVDWGNLQYPEDGDINSGSGFNVYAQVYEPGVTDSSGQGAGITVWIGYSQVDNDPTDSANDSDWTWVEATYNTDSGNNDEYVLDLENEINSGGTYYYASRFQLNGGPYKYGGYNGGFWDHTYASGTGNKSGRLILNAIDWCNLQHPEDGTIFEGSSFNVYAQIHEPGVTDSSGQGANVSAWIGYSQTDNDPSDPANTADWTWIPASYNTDSGNNDEYVADLGSAINASGTYYYASRFQLHNGDYYYGGYNGGFWSDTYASGTGNKSGRLIINSINISNVTQTPSSVYDTDTVSISADVTADAGVYGVELHWGTSSGSLSNTIAMSNTSGDTYTTDSDIPAQSAGTTIYYEIYVLDNDANDKTSNEYNYTVNSGTAPCASELIISEYIEGSGNNKYIELYNGTGSDVDLSNYELRQYNNGSSSVSYTLSLSGTITDNDVFVIENSSESLGVSADLSTSSNVMNFNGDDAIELYNTATGSSVDIIGKIGEDPGSAWGSGSTTTQNHTLVRKADITSGDTDGSDDFDPATEWEGYAQDEISYLGSHTMNCGSCSAPTTDAVFDSNSPSSITSISATLSWSNGGGDKRIVVLREGSAVTFTPADDTTYTANSSFGAGTDVSGNGEYVVYNDSGNSVDLSGLSAGKHYYAKIFEYNCSAGSEKYYTSGTPAEDIFVTVPNNPADFTTGCVTQTSIEFTWSAPASGDFDGYLLVVREGNSAPHSVDSTAPSSISNANTDYGSAGEYGSTTPYSKYLYIGTNTSATITGLTAGTEYTFKLYTYAEAGSAFEYASGTQTTQTIKLNDVNDAHASPGNTKATVYWVNPTDCYDEILVVANETAGIDFTPNGDGSAYTANPNYSAPDQVVYKGNDNNVVVSDLTNGTTYYFEIFIRKGTEWSNGVEVSATPVDATEFQPGQLIFVGYDGQINGSGADDEYLIATLIDIEPGTTFSLVNSRYEAGAAAGVRTDKWGGAGDDASENPGVAEITYNGTSNIPAGSILRMQVDYSTSFITYLGVITGTTETDQTSDFSAYVVYGNTAVPNISSSGSDQMYLTQGVFIFDGTEDAEQANYTLQGTLLHGITNRAAWVDLADACNGDSSGGNTRESRLHPSLNCFNVENTDSSAISGFYQNDEIHSGSFRDIILGISDSTHWTLGTGRYTLDPSTTNESDAGHTFTISGGHNPGTWVSTSDTNWFNCSNWETLAVPDQTTDVYIDANSTVNAVIDNTATDADLFNGIASCHNLEISNLSLVVEGNQTLNIYGNLDIQSGGTLDANDSDDSTTDGQIYIYGNWTNADESNFDEGNSSVFFVGSSAQTVNTNGGNQTEEFYNISINNPQGVTFSSGNIHATHNLSILSSPAITVNNGNYLLAGNNLVNHSTIIVENEGSLVQTTDTGSISGTGTFQLNKTSLPLNNYWEYVYWSSPINSTGFTLGDIVSGAWRYYKFDPNEANNGHTYPGWVMLSAGDVPEKGTGYAVSAPSGAAANTILNPQFVNGSDPFNNGEISVSVLKKGGPDNIGDFNLVGNPYPSAIDFNALASDAENSNIEAAYSLWTNCQGLDANGHHQSAGYTTYSVSGTSTSACSAGTAAAGQYIATGQGFMIEANTDNSTLKFKNAYRVTDNNDNFLNRTVQNDIAWIDMTDNTGNFSQIAVGFYPNASDSFDRNFDASRMKTGSG
jgi:endonuclease I